MHQNVAAGRERDPRIPRHTGCSEVRACAVREVETEGEAANTLVARKCESEDKKMGGDRGTTIESRFKQ